VFQALGRFKALEAVRPTALPMEGEGAQAHDRNTQADQAAVGNAMEVAKPG
jgi:hypothetical protein